MAYLVPTPVGSPSEGDDDRDGVSPLDVVIAPVDGPRGGMGSAVRWMGSVQVGTQVIRVLGTVGLARLLTPADFGLVALVSVIAGMFEQVLGDTGTTSALVRHDRLTQRLASSVLFWNLMVGATTTLFFVVAARPLATLLGDVDATGVARVIGCLAFVNATTYVQTGLFRRTLQFKKVATANLVNVSVTMGATLVLAALGWGAWALAVGTVTGSAAAAALTWIWSDWRPSLHFSWNDLTPIRGFSARLSLQNFFTYSIQVGDRFLVGRLLGVTDLGYYGMANRLLNYPLQTSAQTFREVVYPNLARIKDDDEAMRTTYRRTVGGIALVMVPLCLTIAAVAGPMVHVVLGRQWIPAIPLISIIAVVGALQSLTTTTGPIYIAKGRVDLLLRWSSFSCVVLLGCYLVGARWGVTGVGLGFLAGITVLTYPAFRIPLRLIDARPSYLLGAVAGPVLCAVAGAGAAFATVRAFAAADRPEWVALLAGLGVSGVVTVGLLAVLRPPAWRDGLTVLMRRRRPPRPSRQDPVADTPAAEER